MKKFIYYTDEASFVPSDDAMIARIGPCNSMDELYDQLSSDLHFPTYFGRNLDALWDCMCSLYDVSEKYVTIVHVSPFSIPEDKFKKYVTLMADAINIWALDIHHEFPFVGGVYGPEHYLDVAFPEEMRSRIESILKREESSSIFIVDEYRKNLERHKSQT